jgi:hypothetical protein
MRTFFLFVFLSLLVFLSVAPTSGQTGTDNGYFRVESNPTDAQVLVDNIYRGNTPVLVAVSASGPATHTIVVSKPGYFPWSRTYDTGPAIGETISVVAVLDPSLQFGTLVVTSNPAGALITIDGGKGQQAPWTYSDIAAGSHIVRAFLSGYQPVVTLVNVPPGGTIAVEARLLPLSDVGVIQVKSNPGGADVYVDGFYSGATATTIGNLAAGSHFIQLRLAGYYDWIDTVQVLSNQVTTIDATLEVASTEPTGSIVVSSSPPGASVYIDGSYQGITQQANPLDLTGIMAGTHSVRFVLENYQDFTTTVSVRAGQTAFVNAEMLPASNPTDTATLQINSEPEGANVFLDNACAGITPLTLSSVKAGSHDLLVRLQGYNDYSTTITITPGQVLQIQAGLTPIATQTGIAMIVIPGAILLALALFVRKD